MNATESTSPSARMRDFNAAGHAVTIKYRDYEFTVKPRGDRNDARAYFTNDIDDAIDTALDMQSRLFPGL